MLAAVTAGAAGAGSAGVERVFSGVAEIFSYVAAVTTGVTAAATRSSIGLTAASSLPILPSHATRLASAKPRTNEITREVVSLA